MKRFILLTFCLIFVFSSFAEEKLRLKDFKTKAPEKVTKIIQGYYRGVALANRVEMKKFAATDVQFRLDIKNYQVHCGKDKCVPKINFLERQKDKAGNEKFLVNVDLVKSNGKYAHQSRNCKVIRFKKDKFLIDGEFSECID